MDKERNRKDEFLKDEIMNQIIDKIYRKIETKFDDLLSRLMNVNVNDNASKQKDYTIADVARITGCGKNKAYRCKDHGEYQMGGSRMIRRNIFDYRRAQGNYKLIPKIGRKNCKEINKKRIDFESSRFRLFKAHAIQYIDFKPKNDLEWLVVAQHYGLSTRLLDWTYNPLVALYFAVRNDIQKNNNLNGAFYHAPLNSRRYLKKCWKRLR